MQEHSVIPIVAREQLPSPSDIKRQM